MIVRKLAVLAPIVLLFTSPALYAQSGNSAISGLVKDTTGAALPGVSIVVRNVDTAVSFDAGSNEDGRATTESKPAWTASSRSFAR
jgi:hypothetical protein